MAVNIDKQLLGGINSDVNIQNVAPQDYLDALNITAKRRQAEAGEDIYPLLGEEYPFSQGPNFNQTDIVSSGRLVRILLPTLLEPTNFPAVPLGFFIIRNENGTPITPSGPAIVGGTTWATVDTDWQTYIAGLTAHVGSSVTFGLITDNPEYYGYFDIRITNMGAYTIEFSSLYPQYTLPIQIAEDVISTNFYARGGIAKMIGSCRDARGTYIFTTPKPNVDLNYIIPSIVAVTNTVNLAICSNTIVTFGNPHGLNQWERISIVGCTDAVHINGIWQVVIVSDTEVALVSSNLSIFVPGTGTGALTTFLYDTIGSIGYIESDINTLGGIENNFGAKFTELITTTAFDFTHEHPIDATAKYNNYNSIVKWTDNNSKPKMMVYNGYPLIAGGYIFGPNNWAGRYRYETLAITSNLQIADQNFKLSVSQTTGGALTARNFVYLACGVTEDGSQTTFSFPTNPISCVAANTVGVSALESYKYTGNDFNEATNKTNIITINNIQAGIYQKIRVVCLRYSPLAFDLFQFKEVFLTPGQTSVIVEHTGLENNITVSTEEVTQVFVSVSKALNISELLNTTILSNLTIDVDENLSDVVNGIEYQVRYITALNPFGPCPSVPTNAFPLGEYADANNQPNYMSFMLFETVRCGIIFKRRGGGWTKVYHIDDIRIDDSPIAGRRVGTLTSLKCTQGEIATISFQNLDWDFILPSGLKLRQVYEDARFVRAEIIPQVRMAGMAFQSIHYFDPILGNTYAYLSSYAGNSVNIDASHDRNYLYFMSFDGMNSGTFPIKYESGMQLICCGSPGTSIVTTGRLYEYFNWETDSASLQVMDIIAMQPLADDNTSSVVLDPAYPIGFIEQDYTGYLGGTTPNGSPIANRIYGMIVDPPIANATSVGATDIGMYYCFVYQPNVVGYPENPADSKYFDMNYTSVNADTDTKTTQYIQLSGGNCYAQNTFMGLKKIDPAQTTFPNVFDTAMSFMSYNRNNSQVQKRTFPYGYAPSSPVNITQCIAGFIPSVLSDDSIKVSSTNYLKYTLAYTKRLYLPQLAGYDPSIPETGTAQATIVWSLPTIENSEWNNDRVFLPLNRRDLDLTFGPIWGSFVLNKILITVQTDYIERQYFDNTGYLISNLAPAILGTGDTMGRRGDAITMIGSSNKWSMFLGMSNSGNQFLYGVDAKRFKFWRVGADGTTILSDQYKIDFLSKKNLTLAKFFNNPIKNQGLTGVYDIKNEAAIFTSVVWNSKKNVEIWQDGTTYDAGKLVLDENCDYSYEGIPIIFRCIQTHTSTSFDRPRLNNSLSKQYWEAIPYTNTDFYNVFTLVFYEDRNVFKTFIGYYHSHMAGFEDTYVVMPNVNRFPRPIVNSEILAIEINIPPLTFGLCQIQTTLPHQLGPGVAIYITGVTGCPDVNGYYSYTSSLLPNAYQYSVTGPDGILIYLPFVVAGPYTGGGTITAQAGAGGANTPQLYVHRELCSVLKWYPCNYVISTQLYSWTAGDTFVGVGAQLASLIPNSGFWDNMVLTFDFNGEIREATLLTEDTIYFTEPLTFSDAATTLIFSACLSKDGYITPVINENRGSLVKFCNFRFNSLIAPYRVDLNTQVHESYLETPDFVSYDTIHDAPIKMDTTGGFTPDTGESVLFGKFMKVKITFKKLTEQFIHKFGTGIRLMSSEKKRRT